MKFNFDQKNLDWNNATCLDYRYIWYLARMIDERYLGIGIIPGNVSLTNSNVIEYMAQHNITNWNISRFTPFGILTWDHMQMLYSATMFLGLFVYYKNR